MAAVDADRNRIAARRLGDGARATFDGDYVREHITHGYAVTVHTAQGVTADTSHVVLGENTTRAALYVAMTRGREANNAYLYERPTEASEYSDAGADGPLVVFAVRPVMCAVESGKPVGYLWPASSSGGGRRQRVPSFPSASAPRR